MQLRYIDSKGMEQIRVERKEGKSAIVSQEKLQDKADRYYFQKSLSKPLEQVWFSALDLNVEHAKIEKPYRPTLRAILPIKHQGHFFGLLIINYNMQNFLQKLINAPLYDMILFNNQGFTLLHYQNNRSWSYYSEPKFTLAQEFPKSFKDILASPFLHTEHFVSRKFDVPIQNGLNILLKLKHDYMVEQNRQSRQQYIYVSILIFLFSVVLTLLVIKFFSKTLFNIAQIKRLNATFHQLNLRNKLAMRASQIGIWEWDYATNTLKWDKQMYQIYGIQKTKEQNPYTMWSLAVDQGEIKKVEKNLNDAVKRGIEYDINFWIITPNGERRYIKALGINDYTKRGKAFRMVGTNQDITKLKLAEQKYKTILNLASNGVFLMDLAGNLLEYSHNTAKMLGYNEEEMAHLSVYDWDKGVSEEIFKNMVDSLDGEDLHFERVHTRKDGSTFDVQISATKISIQGKAFLYASARDITENKRNQQKILEQKEALEHANSLLKEQNQKLEVREREIQAINATLEKRVAQKLEELRQKEQLLLQQSKLATMGEMLGNIAHQWRQPLNVLALKKDILVDDYFANELSDEKIESFDEEIDVTLQYMSKTIDDFRNFFKPSKEKVTFDLLETIESVNTIVQAQLGNHNIDLSIQSNNPHINLVGYPNEFKQVLINLINNAKDAIIKEQNPNLYGKISITIDYRDASVDIRVKDNGGGIPNKLLPKIFEPYFTTKFRSQGTGLGLYMSKTIIEVNMQGKLRIQNLKGGAEFTITLYAQG